MGRVGNFFRQAGSRIRKAGQTVVNGIRTGAQKVGQLARRAYDFTRNRLIPGAVNAYHSARRFLGNVNRAVETGSDAAGRAANIIGGKAGEKIKQGKEKFDQKYQQVKDKVGQLHKKGEDVYRKGEEAYKKGKKLVELGRNTYNQAKQNMKA